MLWLNRHARFRNDLSAYADGALSPDKAHALEQHLSGCEACRTELDELRSIASAVRDMPKAEVPRSFVLTPNMLERRAAVPPAPSAPSLVAGMRLASAAVAVVLTVVVIGDLSSAGDGNGGAGGGSRLESAMQSRDSAPSLDAESGAGAEAGNVPPAPAATGVSGEYAADDETADREAEATATPSLGNFTAICPSAAKEPISGEGTADAPASTIAPIPETVPTPTGNLDARVESRAAGEPAGVTCLDKTAQERPGVTDVTALEPVAESGGETADGALSDEGGGVSTLRVAEIVLAGVLIALLSGVGVDFALRRRRTT